MCAFGKLYDRCRRQSGTDYKQPSRRQTLASGSVYMHHPTIEKFLEEISLDPLAAALQTNECQCRAGDGAGTAATRQCLRPVAAAPSPVGGTAGAGSPLRRPGRESAPGAGIRSMPNLHNFAARPVELQLRVRTGAGPWYSQEQAIQAQPCGFAVR